MIWFWYYGVIKQTIIFSNLVKSKAKHSKAKNRSVQRKENLKLTK